MTGLEVAEVQAYMEYFDSEVDINSALSLRFGNGALGTIAVVGNSPTGGIWEDITIWGTKAVVYIRQGQIFYKTQHSNEVYEVNNLPGSTTPDQNFIDAILGRDQVQVPPECGLRVIELTEAAWASAASGQPVKVKKHLTWFFAAFCHIKRKSSSGATSSCYRYAEARGYASEPARLCNWPQRRAELEYGL